MSKLFFEEALRGGDPRSLGRAEEIVGVVLKDPRRVDELFECQFSDDELVRMRGSDALENVCRQRPDLLEPYIDRLLVQVSRIEQPSVQWHLAQMLAEIPLDGRDRRRAIAILKRNLLSGYENLRSTELGNARRAWESRAQPKACHRRPNSVWESGVPGIPGSSLPGLGFRRVSSRGTAG